MLTSVNQCRLRGTVVEGDDWVVHDGFGYFFPSGDKFVVRAEKQTGSWNLINQNFPNKPVEEGVFSLWLDHGKSPKRAGYEYVVVPGVKPDEMPGYVKKASIEILSNSGNVQEVRHSNLASSRRFSGARAASRWGKGESFRPTDLVW